MNSRRAYRRCMPTEHLYCGLSVLETRRRKLETLLKDRYCLAGHGGYLMGNLNEGIRCCNKRNVITQTALFLPREFEIKCVCSPLKS